MTSKLSWLVQHHTLKPGRRAEIPVAWCGCESFALVKEKEVTPRRMPSFGSQDTPIGGYG